MASSGITLRTVPAWKLPTVTTTGSKTLNLRVTMACSAVTISQAAGIGSMAWCGAEPWPPRPCTVTSIASIAARAGPGRAANTPASYMPEKTCSA